MSRGIRHGASLTTYGGRVIRSDLALAALATAAVPGMRPVSVAAIRTGEDGPQHQSALIEDVTGRTWLIRSPLGAAAGAELERNGDLVRQLGRHLPFRVPAAAGYADLGADGRAVVYPYVEGLALNLRHLPVGPGLASAVGRAIAAVHNMPRELFEEFAVPVFDADQVRARKLSELDRAAETGHVPNGLLARWEQALDAVPLWRFATVPTHGTLDGSSFLVAFADDTDAASGRVVALTGWERAAVGDPAEDFARLVELANPRAVDSAFESYSLARSQRPDGYLLHRARLASEMRLLHGLAAAVASGAEAFVRRRADELRKLDRLTTSDTSLVPRTALTPVVAVPDPDTSPALEHTAEPGEDEPDHAGQGATTEEATDGTADGTADVDATGPVPRLPVDADGDADDEPAVVVEPATDTHLEPVSAADVTAPIPIFRPVATVDEDSTAPTETGAHATSEPTSTERESTEPGSTEQQSTEAESTEQQSTEAESAEPASTTAPRSAADPEPASVTDSQEESQDEALEVEPAGAEQTATADEDEADLAAHERLQTLYGMPESDVEGGERKA